MTIKDKIENFLQSHADRQVFREHEVKDLLRGFGINTPSGMFVARGDVPPATVNLSYPLVAKLVSSGISSKSDVGGVRLGIGNNDELRSAVAELSRIDQAEGVLVEEMAPPGFEVIVGGTMDITFGPVVMFGMGGFFVELFRDVSFALAPVTREQALWLVSETRGEKVLKGFRGKPALDIDAVAEIIVTVSEIIASGLVRAIDLNPVVLYPHGAMALDAKMSRP